MDPNVVLNAFTPSEYDIILSYLAPQCKVRQYKEETLLSCQFCQAPGQFREGLKNVFFRNYFQTVDVNITKCSFLYCPGLILSIL